MAIPRPVFRALPRCPGAVTGRPGRALRPASCLDQACSLLGTRTYPSHASALKRYRGLCRVRMGPVARGVHAWVRQAQGASTWPRYVLTGSRAGPTPAGMGFNRPRTKNYSVAALSGSTIRGFRAVRLTWILSGGPDRHRSALLLGPEPATLRRHVSGLWPPGSSAPTAAVHIPGCLPFREVPSLDNILTGAYQVVHSPSSSQRSPLVVVARRHVRVCCVGPCKSSLLCSALYR